MPTAASTFAVKSKSRCRAEKGSGRGYISTTRHSARRREFPQATISTTSRRGGAEPSLLAWAGLADTTKEMIIENRDRERVPLGGQVTGEVMVYQPVTIVDISQGGAQIETQFPLQLRSEERRVGK